VRTNFSGPVLAGWHGPTRPRAGSVSGVVMGLRGQRLGRRAALPPRYWAKTFSVIGRPPQLHARNFRSAHCGRHFRTPRGQRQRPAAGAGKHAGRKIPEDEGYDRPDGGSDGYGIAKGSGHPITAARPPPFNGKAHEWFPTPFAGSCECLEQSKQKTWRRGFIDCSPRNNIGRKERRSVKAGGGKSTNIPGLQRLGLQALRNGNRFSSCDKAVSIDANAYLSPIDRHLLTTIPHPCPVFNNQATETPRAPEPF